MAEISNRFFVTALDDGTTLHGNLTSDRSLTQAWNGTAAIPDWTQTANQPTIYLTLLDGSTLVTPTDFQWYHDSSLITFDSSTGISTDKLFKKTTKSVTYNGTTLSMPALQIVGNIATSSNVDSDTISISGSYNINSAPVDFSASTQIRITQITANGYLGVIIFPDGASDITADKSSIQMYGVLYDNTGTATSVDHTNWYLNSSTTATAGVSITDSSGATHENGYTVYEEDQKDANGNVTAVGIVDHAMIRCDFIEASGSPLYSAYAAVDDLTDPEFMYIQYNGANGNAASLRTGETAKFTIWVGKEGDTTVDTSYNVFKMKVLAGDSSVSKGEFSDIPNVDEGDTEGLRTITNRDTAKEKAIVEISYNTVVSLGKNMTALVYAYSSTTTTT